MERISEKAGFCGGILGGSDAITPGDRAASMLRGSACERGCHTNEKRPPESMRELGGQVSIASTLPVQNNWVSKL